MFSFSDYKINLDNLIGNINNIKLRLNDGVKFCAVVKANAYGVGADIVAPAVESDVDCFAVSNLEEGIQLRRVGIKKNIIVLGSVDFDHLNKYVENFLTPSVGGVLEMNKLSRDLKGPLQVEFALNTGMNRYGMCKKTEIRRSISIINKNKNINLFGAFSHLSTKENDVDYMYKQKYKFDALIEPIKNKNVIFHLSNTNASLYHNDFNYDMVRVGFGMYDVNGKYPVVSIESRIVHINKIKDGESVGYDRTYRTNGSKKIAVVPLGYYDGVSRLISGKGWVIIKGEYVPIVGRVCMDCFMVDVTDVADAVVGDKVILIGEQGGRKITIKDHADIIGTSEYEVLARFNNSRMNTKIYKSQ